MRNDITEMKKVIVNLMKGDPNVNSNEKREIITKLDDEIDSSSVNYDFKHPDPEQKDSYYKYNEPIQENVEVEESLSLEEREKELIIKALEKHNSRRKNAALELGISERTLYRKIKEYDINK